MLRETGKAFLKRLKVILKNGSGCCLKCLFKVGRWWLITCVCACGMCCPQSSLLSDIQRVLVGRVLSTWPAGGLLSVPETAHWAC